MNNTLLVQHDVYWDKGVPFFAKSKSPKVYPIVHHYIGGRVRLATGDIWQVKRVCHPEYEYVTVGMV